MPLDNANFVGSDVFHVMRRIVNNARLEWFMTVFKRNVFASLEHIHPMTAFYAWLVMPFVEPVQVLQAANAQTAQALQMFLSSTKQPTNANLHAEITFTKTGLFLAVLNVLSDAINAQVPTIAQRAIWIKTREASPQLDQDFYVPAFKVTIKIQKMVKTMCAFSAAKIAPIALAKLIAQNVSTSCQDLHLHLLEIAWNAVMVVLFA